MVEEAAHNPSSEFAGLVHLGAADDRVWLAAPQGPVAETEGEVWRQGACTITCSHLEKLLAQLATVKELIFEADGEQLHAGEHAIDLLEFSLVASRPDHPHIFLAANFGQLPAGFGSVYHCRTL